MRHEHWHDCKREAASSVEVWYQHIEDIVLVVTEALGRYYVKQEVGLFEQ